MKILIDVAGADKGLEVPITAAIKMVDKIEETIVLVGRKDDIKSLLSKFNKQEYINKFEILDCLEYITNNDEPAFAIKNKKESNLVVAFEYMKKNKNTVFISASNTGALMAGGLLKLGRIKGIHRPALMSLLPASNGKSIVFLDSGANPEAKSISLLQYAKLGELYAENILNIENPSIGLLNIGAEEEKGTPTLKETYKNLKEKFPNFSGNIEARYILNSNVDVIVCDGLMGNIAIKSLEGTASILKNVITKEFKKTLLNKLIGLIAKPVLNNALKKFDYKRQGGAVLLGVNKPVIKLHGNSSVITYEKAVEQADKILKTDMIGKIKEKLNKK